MNRTRSLLLFLFLNRLGAYKMEFSNSHTNVKFTTSPPYRKINRWDSTMHVRSIYKETQFLEA